MILLAFGLLFSALAQDPAPAAADDNESGETILVMGDRVAVARAQLDQDLKRLGLTRVRRRSDSTLYAWRGSYRWKPKVEIHDDGLLEFHAPRVVFLPPGLAGEAAVQPISGVNDPATTAPARGDVSLGFPIMFPSKRMQTRVKGEVLDVIAPDMTRLTDALADVALDQNINGIGARLDALWRTGVNPRGGPVIADQAGRRAALLDLWATRTDSEAGRAMRVAIGDYLDEVVQISDTPVSPGELASANNRRQWGAPLQLQMPAPPTPAPPTPAQPAP